MPKEKYSFAPEIYEHSQRIARHVTICTTTACFQTKVTGSALGRRTVARWIVSTDRDDAMKARFVVMATGPLNRPKLPAVPGIEEFAGPHVPHQPLGLRLHRRRSQRRPDETRRQTRRDHRHRRNRHSDACRSSANTRSSLYVFQRTPSSVDLRGNKPTDPNWAKTLKPGWQRERRENFNAMVTGQPVDEDLVNDGWTEIFRNLASMTPQRKSGRVEPEEAAMLAELADFKKMNGIRERVDETVKDPDAAEALKPWYRQFCKRPTFNDEYLPTFNRPNVTLIDTSDTQGVERDHGERRDRERRRIPGRLHHLRDRLRSGHRVDAPRRLRHPIGKDGVRLSDYWAAGMKTLHGFSSHGFPNCFLMGLSQNGVLGEPDVDARRSGAAHRLHHQAGDGARRAICAPDGGSRSCVGCRNPQARRECRAHFSKRARRVTTTTKVISCSARRGLNGEAYSPGANAFNALLAKWREKGDLEGLELG